VQSKTVEEFKTYAQQHNTVEVCALVVAVGRKQQLIICENVHEKPESFFKISGRAWSDAEDIGEIAALVV